MQIRQATTDDFPALFSLMVEFSKFQKTPEKLTITLDEMIANKACFQCIVSVNEQHTITGFASYFFAYYSWSGKALYIDDLYVIPACRAKGLGTALWKALKVLARKENCKKMRWQVSKWNQQAIRFYKKEGAVIDEVEINCELMVS